MEAETGGTRPWAKDSRSPQQLEEAGRILPYSLRREHEYWTSRLQNCERIAPCCLKAPSWWKFVTVAPGNSYRGKPYRG